MRPGSAVLFFALAACDGSALLSLLHQGGPASADPLPPDLGGGVDDVGVAGDGPYLPPPDTVLRRLTRREFVNTVRDLLFLADAPAGDGLPADSTPTLFDNNAETLSIDDTMLEKYDDVAAAAVHDALFGGARARLVPCDLQAGGPACLEQVVSAFARRAFRRPVERAELDGLLAVAAAAAAQGEGPDASVELALRSALVSASLLYRVELDAAGVTGEHPVSGHELATRLSYFIWSSTPDDELLARADDGTLQSPDVAAAQVARMLADPKARALIDGFGAQWLDLGKLETVGVLKVDAAVFPSFDEPLRLAMAAESKRFLRDLLEADQSMASALDSDVTFVNERLARHYGLQGVTGDALRRVSLAGTPRLGLLAQGSVLTLTSVGNRTSPTRRGKWVLSRLLCAPPPPPPPNVEELDEMAAGLPPDATVRQTLEAHRKDPHCASCHATMDPIGLGLENYDGIGAWRTLEGSRPIDATGELPGGLAFDGAQQLARLLKEDARLLPCFVENVYSYALGRRAKSAADQAAIHRLSGTFAANGARAKELIRLVATSRAFRNRGGQP